MTGQSRLDDALNKFDEAMRNFEATIVRERHKEAKDVNTQAEYSALLEDRSQLAADLDRSKAQLSKMSVNNSEAEKRLDAAMATIKSILDKQ